MTYKTEDRVLILRVNAIEDDNWVGRTVVIDYAEQLNGYICIHDTKGNHIHATKIRKVYKLPKLVKKSTFRSIKKVCSHDLVFVDKFSTEMFETYRFVCRKPKCLMIIDVTK